jgi:predicted DCC family thiol-disulfide oxidoreductase YuxK
MNEELLDRARRSVVVIRRDGTVLTAARACLFVLDELKLCPRLVAVVSRQPALALAEIAYRAVAGARRPLGKFLARRRARRRADRGGRDRSP